MKMLTAMAIVALLPAVSQAARPWLLPSQTVLARSGGWVALDAAQADDLFSANQGALSIDTLVVMAPDGSSVPPQNVAKGKSRSSFDLELRQPGTYRVTVAEDVVAARWQEAGKPKRWRGAAADMAGAIPRDASELEVEQNQRRIETFITVGVPSELKSAGAGITLVPLQHPNDLYAGETAKFRFLLDGKPAAKLPVEIVAGGNRYRDTQNEMKLETGADGIIEVTWPAAGMYWLEAAVQDDNASAPNVRKRRATYVATLEVLTQ